MVIDLREPFLDKGILDMGDNKEVIIQGKDEKLPHICHFCSRIGHVERDCEDMEEEEKRVVYGYGERTHTSTGCVAQHDREIQGRGALWQLGV